MKTIWGLELFPVRSYLLCLALFLSTLQVLDASPWAIVTDFADSTIHTIDLGTNPPTVYGPFLEGQIVAASRVGAVKVLPGDRSALLAGAYSNMWLLDIADPRLPFVSAFVGPNMATHGLAVSRNGRLAVTVNQVAFWILDLRALVLSGASLPLPVADATSVAIASNNSTVVFTDLANNRLIYGDVNSSLTGFVSLNTFGTASPPQKVAIAPDGQTVLVGANDLEVFRLTGAGLSRGTPPTLPVGAQSFAFEPNGNRVYALSWASNISILRVEAPGVVSVEARNVVTIPTYVSPPSSGIDMLAITPDGQRLVVGNSLDTKIFVVQVGDMSVTVLGTLGRSPTGVDIFAGQQAPSVGVPTLSLPAAALIVILLGLAGVLILRH